MGIGVDVENVIRSKQVCYHRNHVCSIAFKIYNQKM